MRGETLRVLLAKNRMTMAALEEETGIRQPTIRKLMDEIPRNVRVSTLDKVVAALPGVRLVIAFVEVEYE